MKVSLQSAVVVRDVQRISQHLTVRSDLSGCHLLITGCTGFFGKWLLATLNHINSGSTQVEVTAISRSPDQFLLQYPEYANCGWINWVKADVQNLDSVRLSRPVDLIIHAATDTLAGAHADPLKIFDTILGGARQVLELAVRSGARRLLFTGSGAQYGLIASGQPVPEGSHLACDSLQPSSAYAEAKRAQETLAALYAQRHGFEVVLSRCFAFSGPGIALDGHFAIGNFVRDALWRDELILQSSGNAVRSYLHGADLAGWLLTLLIKGEGGQAYNVGSGEGLSIARLARCVVDSIAPHKPVRVLGQDAPGQVRSYYVPDISKCKALGLDTWTSLSDSIRSMADWAGEAG